jgi:hypothetical protein
VDDVIDIAVSDALSFPQDPLFLEPESGRDGSAALVADPMVPTIRPSSTIATWKPWLSASSLASASSKSRRKQRPSIQNLCTSVILIEVV